MGHISIQTELLQPRILVICPPRLAFEKWPVIAWNVMQTSLQTVKDLHNTAYKLLLRYYDKESGVRRYKQVVYLCKGGLCKNKNRVVLCLGLHFPTGYLYCSPKLSAIF